jgi:hypothetical protein
MKSKINDETFKSLLPRRRDQPRSNLTDFLEAQNNCRWVKLLGALTLYE